MSYADHSSLSIGHPHDQATARESGWLPSALIWAIVLISFRPFASQTTSVNGISVGGDIVNQLGFGALGVICLCLLAFKAPFEQLKAFLKPAFVATLGVLLLSVATSDGSGAALRAMTFSLIVVACSFTPLVLLENKSDFVKAITSAAAAAVAFSYMAVLFFPAQGIHPGGGFEPQHAGLWRGVYAHKNVASYVMGAYVLIGWFALRNGQRAMGLLLAVSSILFVVMAGSKTVLGILPVAFVIAGIATLKMGWFLRLLVIATPVSALFVATLGAVIHPPMLEWLQSLIPGLTYTGRTDLWTFGLEFIKQAPWRGYGFESFWGTPKIVFMEQPIELTWDVRGIVHGHNSWLDSAISFGIPGAVVITYVLLLRPVIDYLKVPCDGNASQIAHLFLSIWLLTILGANLESFFFRRADPVWFCMLIAVLGLRLTAHMTRPRTQ